MKIVIEYWVANIETLRRTAIYVLLSVLVRANACLYDLDCNWISYVILLTIITKTLKGSRYSRDVVKLEVLSILQPIDRTVLQQDHAHSLVTRSVKGFFSSASSMACSRTMAQTLKGSYLGKLPLWPTGPLRDFHYGPEHKRSTC
ncbi:hypothetical protein TNCV_1980501 [Trichonephila clavipes]|nr:hypothetical protein TNCV_1980501 [Trichonephila clavipes]